MELFLADAEWREAIMEAVALPSDCGALAIRYVGMFRAQGRSLTPDRAKRLIKDVCSMIVDGTSFDRQELKAPSHVWRQAIIDILDAPGVKRPLKNHNYLLRILQSKLAQKADLVQVAEAASRQSHTRKDLGLQRIGSTGHIPDPEDPLDSLSESDRERWMSKAEKSLLTDEKIAPQFISKGLVEQKARELLRATNNA